MANASYLIIGLSKRTRRPTRGVRPVMTGANLMSAFIKPRTEIARQEFIGSFSDETRAENRKSEQEFKSLFANDRPAFDQIFEDRSRQRPSLREVTEILLGGAYLEIGADLVAKATGIRPTGSEVKEFMDRCPPFKALLAALSFTHYDRCIRGENEPSLGKAGRLDMYSAVFLPYCKLFVTNDEGQCKALTAITELLGLDVSVVMYGEFKGRLYGLTG